MTPQRNGSNTLPVSCSSSDSSTNWPRANCSVVCSKLGSGSSLTRHPLDADARRSAGQLARPEPVDPQPERHGPLADGEPAERVGELLRARAGASVTGLAPPTGPSGVRLSGFASSACSASPSDAVPVSAASTSPQLSWNGTVLSHHRIEKLNSPLKRHWSGPSSVAVTPTEASVSPNALTLALNSRSTMK